MKMYPTHFRLNEDELKAETESVVREELKGGKQ
jgi:hypothetical protein